MGFPVTVAAGASGGSSGRTTGASPLVSGFPRGSRDADRGADCGTVLWRYLLVSFLALLAALAGFLSRASWRSGLGDAWLLAVYVTYALFYLAPVFVPLAALRWCAARPAVARLVARRGLPVRALLLAAAVLGTTVVQLLLYADSAVLKLYGFHLNGFVWNLVTTPGGIESMEAGRSTRLTVAGIAVLFLALQGALMLLALRSRALARLVRGPPCRRALWGLGLGALLLSGSERVTFCIAGFADYRPVLANAGAFPLYVPLHWRALGRALGFAKRDEASLTSGRDGQQLRYPLAPVALAPGSRDWNVVWLVAESLRADALDPEIMPATSAFARRCTDFDRHYSGGNGTRMGMFAMFYGLYGNDWFPMLGAHRSPVLMDVLAQQGYDIEAWTSAKFSYPEFDRTLFAGVPGSRLHEGAPGLAGWENDRLGVTALLASLDAHAAVPGAVGSTAGAAHGSAAGAPFFRFMFFESPHARYDFPPESVIRSDVLEDMNYAELDLAHDIGRIRNRYLNACHHLDSQWQRVLDGLAERGLLDSTIVILTGDHGEEFLEHGHWGHNSAFTDEQTRTPLVLWVPGRAPLRVSAMSSHLDLPATLLALLGATGPESDWTLGHDLLGPFRRTSTVISDWDQMALVDEHHKLVLPFRDGRLTGSLVTGADDLPVPDERAAAAACQPLVAATLAQMGRFLK